MNDKSSSHRKKLSAGHNDLSSVLLEGEKVNLEAEIHWGIYWKGAVFLAASAFLMLTPAFNLGAVFSVIALAMLAIAWLTKYYLALVMTDRRILARWGILNLDYVDMRFSQIESAEVYRSLMGRILGYGSVVLAGTGQRVVIVPFVGNSDAFRRALNEILLNRDTGNS